MKAYVAVFVSIFIAELGDKTQLATLLFASDPAVSRVGVFLAAAAALVASSLLAVLVGAGLGAAISPVVLKTVAGVAFDRLTWGPRRAPKPPTLGSATAKPWRSSITPRDERCSPCASCSG